MGNEQKKIHMNFLKILFVVFSSVAVVVAEAQAVIHIETNNHAIVLQETKSKHLIITYAGAKLNNSAEYGYVAGQTKLTDKGAENANLAYPTANASPAIEPAAMVMHADGNTSLELLYQSHSATVTQDGAKLTKVILTDPVYSFFAELYYKVWPQEDVVEQWTVFRNEARGSVMLNKFASANLYFQNKEYYLTAYNNAWGRELRPETLPLKQGRHVVASNLGTRENLFASQNFMLHFDGKATENEGYVMLGQLAWNGNYSIEFETDPNRNLHVIAGINASYQSAYRLRSKESFETPKLVYTFSGEGIGRASRNLHNWLRRHNLLNGQGSRLTLLNNWEATYFDFDQQKVTGLFGGAKALGVDLFLLDDGWFGNKYPRDNATAGLGDWQANRKKLPGGIGYLVKKAEKEGLKFGIWIEPEMVNPKSELYEKHTDWVLREPQRRELYYRDQLVLDLTNPAVQDFVFNVVDKLFTENPSLAFIKWDCNSPIINGHSLYLEKTKQPQSHLFIEYAKGFEKVMQRIRKKYPQVPMMLCAGGGGRTDYSLLKYFTEFWPSDNTDPLDRIFLQWNYSYYYPSIAVCSHVTNWSSMPVKYKVDVASMGKLGFDIKVDELSKEDIAFCRQAVENYNGYKHIVWHGDMYRLADPYQNDFASLMYVNKEKTQAIMFSYLVSFRYAKANKSPVRLQGLDPGKKYRIREINLLEGQASTVTTGKVYSGDFLMKAGFNPDITPRRTSVVLEINVL